MKIGLSSACAVLLVSTLSVSAVEARSTYCCKDDKGTQVCSDMLPPQCYGRAYREINEHGLTIKRTDAPLTTEQRAQAQAEAQQAKEDERRRLEQDRRNRALLATYASEKDIDYMRERAVSELQKAMQQAQAKYDEALARQQKMNGEAEFHKKKGLPPQLAASMRDNDAEMKTQLAAIEEKKKEIEAVRARYDAEKARYRELTAGAGMSAPADVRPR